MLEVLLNVFDTVYISIAAYGVAVALVLLAVLAPSRSAIVRQAGRAISPLWLLLPALAAAALLALGRHEFLVLSVGGNTVPLLFLAQVAVSGWVLWTNRAFPWLVVLAALVLGWIQWCFFIAAQATRA